MQKNNTMTRNKIMPCLFYIGIVCLIVIGVLLPLFSIIAFVLSVIYVVLEKDKTKVIQIIIFLTPFATIFKINPTSISLYTIINLITIVKLCITEKIDKKLVLYYLLFILFCIHGLVIDPMSTIKIMFVPAFVYFAIRNTDENSKYTIFKTFTYAVIIASLIAIFKDNIPNLSNYLVNKELRIDMGVYATRFSGLYADPNYYNINLLLAIAVTIIQLINNKISKIQGVAIIIILVLFGAATYSKSFLIILFVLLVATIYAIYKKKKIKLLLATIILLVISAIALASTKIHIFDITINRFSKNATISDLTTNRTDISNNYINYMNNNPHIYLIGNGLNGDLLNNTEAHNTYLQAIYNFGIIGTIILILTITSGIKYCEKEKSIEYYLPMIVVLLSYLALSELLYIDFQIQIYMILMSLYKTKNKRISKNEI